MLVLVTVLPVFFLVLSPMHFAAAADIRESDERKLWTIWKLHQSGTNSHESVIAACRKMRNQSPTNSLSVISSGIAAWHMLQTGQTNEAISVLEPMISYSRDPLLKAGSKIAHSWLTRIDREKVKNALTIIYNERIEYPKTLRTLKTLPRESVPPLTDRWGTPWKYYLKGYKKIKGLISQSYVLQSQKLGASSDITQALEQPYAKNINLKPLSIVMIGNSQNIKFDATGDKQQPVMSTGTTFKGVTFVYCGLKLIILCNNDYWLVLPKPRR